VRKVGGIRDALAGTRPKVVTPPHPLFAVRQRPSVGLQQHGQTFRRVRITAYRHMVSEVLRAGSDKSGDQAAAKTLPQDSLARLLGDSFARCACVVAVRGG